MYRRSDKITSLKTQKQLGAQCLPLLHKTVEHNNYQAKEMETEEDCKKLQYNAYQYEKNVDG